jgi:hypothetical protein
MLSVAHNEPESERCGPDEVFRFLRPARIEFSKGGTMKRIASLVVAVLGLGIALLADEMDKTTKMIKARFPRLRTRIR